MKLHRNLFSFAVILHSFLTRQQTCLVPSSRDVTVDHVPSLGRAVATANGSTWVVRVSFSAILAVLFQLFAQLAR